MSALPQLPIWVQTTYVLLVIFQAIGMLELESANHATYQTSGIPTQINANHAQQLISMILLEDNVSAQLLLNTSMVIINVWLALLLEIGILLNFNALLVLQVSFIQTVIAFAQLIDHI